MTSFTSSRVLIIEEDGFHALLLANALEAHNHVVEIARDVSGALEKAEAGRFDVIVLDLGSAEQRFGMALCERLRESGNDTPIVALAAHLDSVTKIAALAAGADDCILKPYDLNELLARMHALIRRTRALKSKLLAESQFGNVSVDFYKATAIKDSSAVALSPKEISLLRYMVTHCQCVLSREELLMQVWGYQSTDTRTVDMHVAALRRKLEDSPHQPRHIITVRGRGYLFRE
jgi:DNA-binding response OmpR family regulator